MMMRYFTLLTFGILMVFTAHAQKDLSILLVNDDAKYVENISYVQAAITSSGYSYTDYDAVTGGAPSLEVLNSYELVYWVTGASSTTTFWNETDLDAITANDNLLAYLNGGGMLWLAGTDFMYDAYGGAPDSFTEGDFVYDYLGVKTYAGQAHVDDKVVSDGLPLMRVVEENGICTVAEVTWRWTTMYYADGVEVNENAKAVYQMGPADYDLAAYYCGVYNEKDDAKILSFFIRPDGYETPEIGASVTVEVLDYFNQFSKGVSVDVTSLEITSEAGFEISENNGTIKLSVSAMPEDATNKTVTWSLGEGSVSSTLDQNGLLAASGLDAGNGVVHVIATTNDGTDIVATVDVTISNQSLGDGYKVLLVNDNANGATRYMELDTAIAASEYTYKIYNAAADGVAPSYEYLANFDFVVWYTGNDGVDLHFWDVSDSTNFKCNADLKKFADEGGAVWVQGLDFFYDVYGGNYSAANEEGDSVITAFKAGDFVYDYLGVKSYVAQSHKNETSGVYVGVEQLDIAEENTITTLDPIKWAFSEMWYVDALEVTDNAMPLYYMGPETYDFSLYYAMVYNKKGSANFITSTFETARFDSQDNTNKLFKEVLDYFSSSKTSVKELGYSTNSELSVYPNPASSSVWVQITGKSYSSSTIQVLNLAGKVVIERSIDSLNGNEKQILDVSSLENGAYLISVKGDKMVNTQNLLIAR